MHGRTLGPVTLGSVRLVTVTNGIEGMDDPEKIEFLARMMQRSVDNLERLVEAEIDSGEA
jgi:hypothetical protein